MGGERSTGDSFDSPHPNTHLAPDTALAYEDQPKIAQAIADEGFGRADVWLTSKMPVQGYNATHANMDAILAEFARGGLAGVTDVDLLLLHHPEPSGSAAECQDPHNGTACRLASWQAMLELFAAGKAKAIGVSNYEQRHLDELVAYSQSTGTPLPAVLQSELHPYWHEDADGQYATQCGEPDGKAPRRRLVEWATAHGIVYNSYSPLGAPDLAPARDGWNSTILALPLFERLAAQYGKSPAQIVLRWAVQRGIPVNPRSHNATHMRENLDLFGWALSDADMLAISTQVPAPKAPCKTPPDHCCAKVCADSFSSP